MSANQLRQRQDVPEEQTWRLEDIFPTTAAFNAACSDLISRGQAIGQQQAVLLSDGATLYTVLTAYFQAEALADRIFSYGEHLYNSDMTAAAGQAAYAQAQQTITAFNTATAFVTATLPQITPAQLTAFYAAKPQLEDYAFIFAQAEKRAPHILTAAEETLLSALGQSFRAPETIYNKLNDADIDFGTMKDPHGNTIPLSHPKIQNT